MNSLPPPTGSTPPPPPGSPSTPEPANAGGKRRTPLLIGVAIVAIVALVAGGIIILSGGDDDTADPPPSGSTDPSSDTDPPDTGAPTSTSTGEPAGLDRVVANLQTMAAAQINDCPIGDDVFDTISADAEGPLITQAIEGGIVDVGVAQPDPSGASMVQCSAGSTDGGVGLFVGTLGDLDVGAWIAEHVGAEVELAEAEAHDGEPAFTFDEKNELGRVVGASWSKDGFVATLAAFSTDPNADLRPAGMRNALAGSLDTMVAELAEAQPPDPAETTVPDATDTTLPSETPLDTSAALEGVERATRAGQDETISCPIDPDTMKSFGDQIDGAFFKNAFRDESIFGASVWLRDNSSGGASAFRCTTSGANGLVGMYAGDLGGLDLEGWLQLMGGPYTLDELGTNRGGTVYAVNGPTPRSGIVGSLWTDDRLVVMVLGIDDPAIIDLTAVDTAPGLLTVLQDVVEDVAQA